MNDLNNRISSLEQRVDKLEKAFLTVDIIDSQLKVNNKKISVKEFLLTKNIDNDVKRTLAIGYFMENIEKIPSFNTDDLKKYFQLAKFTPPTNINDRVNMNIKNGHIMEAEEKKDSKKAWILTVTGEKFVESDFNKQSNE